MCLKYVVLLFAVSEVLFFLRFHDMSKQVHRAVLPNGELVVVKVQRPGLRKLFDIDLSEILF